MHLVQPNQDERLDAVITAFLQAVESQLPPDRQEWLTRYPGLAAELTEFFATDTCLDRLTAPLRAVAQVVRAAEPAGQVFGDYELLEEIGRGGMGIVFKARQISLNRVVALKMILAGQFASAEEVQRFRTEAEAAAQLDHPNIVPIYEVGEWQGRHYFSMKLLEGGSLAEASHAKAQSRKEASSLASLRLCVSLLVKVTRAVHYAHQRGILHRDLKPGNILLDAAGEPHVTDFGLAKWVRNDSEQTRTGTIVGTPSYMSPEQARAEKVLTTAADVYGLGANLYALLTGQPPFRGPTPLDTLDQVRSSEPAPPSRHNPALGPDLDAICLKCLEKEPQRRYASAEALATDLERFLAGEPIEARPIRRLQRAWRWCRRNRAVAALSAAAAVLLVSLLTGLTTGLVLLSAKEHEANQHRIAAEEANRALVRQAYATDIKLGHYAWSEGAFDQARRVLAKYARPSTEDLRDFEWHYLWRMVNSVRRTLQPDSGEVYSVAYSPDGSRLATACQRGGLKLWDPTTGDELASFPGHEGDVNWVSFSPDGKRLVTVSDDKTARVWDIASRKALCEFRGHAAFVVCALFTHDGSLAASADDTGVIKVWDVSTAKERVTLSGHMARVQSMALASTNRLLATASSDRSVRLWDLDSGRCALRLDDHPDVVTAVAFSHDDEWLATACGDGIVRLWDADSGQPVRDFRGETEGLESVAFSSDDRLLASGGRGGTLRLWDAETGAALMVLRGRDCRAWCASFSPDGRELAVANLDGEVKLWDVGLLQPSHALSEPVRSDRPVVFLNGGRELFASAGDEGFLAWNLSGSLPTAPARQPAGPFSGLRAIAADTQTVAYQLDAQLALGNLRSGLPGPTLGVSVARLTDIALSPDGCHVAAGLRDGPLHVWDAQTGRLIWTFEDGTSPKTGVAFSPDSRTIATWRGGLHLFEVAAGRQICELRGHRGPIHHAAFSPTEGVVASAAADQTVRLWDANAGAPLYVVPGHDPPVQRVVFSPDGRTLATGDGSVVKLWHVKTGQELFALPRRLDCGIPLGFSPDGKVLACGANPSHGVRRISLWFAHDAANLSHPAK